MTKENSFKELIDKVNLTICFIDEVLFPRGETNKSLLNEYKRVLFKFKGNNQIEFLKELRKISARPSLEGAKFDFTEGISLPLGGTYMTLGGLVYEIEKLIYKIEGDES